MNDRQDEQAGRFSARVVSTMEPTVNDLTKYTPADVGLVKHPQRFFVLPTLWFWSNQNTPKILPFVLPPSGIAALYWVFFVARIAGLPGLVKVLLSGIGGAGIAYLMLGLAERALRIAVARRRKQRALSESRAASLATMNDPGRDISGH